MQLGSVRFRSFFQSSELDLRTLAERLIWEAYKEALKVWEKENPASEDVKWEEERKQKQTHHGDLVPEA